MPYSKTLCRLDAFRILRLVCPVWRVWFRFNLSVVEWTNIWSQHGEKCAVFIRSSFCLFLPILAIAFLSKIVSQRKIEHLWVVSSQTFWARPTTPVSMNRLWRRSTVQDSLIWMKCWSNTKGISFPLGSLTKWKSIWRTRYLILRIPPFRKSTFFPPNLPNGIRWYVSVL